MKRILVIIFIFAFILTAGCLSGAETIGNANAYFFKNNISEVNYKGKFLMDDIFEKDVKLKVNKVTACRNGDLYELKLDPIEGIPHDRLSLGFFYVLKDKIYKIEPTKVNISKLKVGRVIPNDSVIVCCDKGIKDVLSKNEIGWHHFIEAKGNKREYHSYNNKISTGYYESFIWEKNKGLVKYQSGYGAERDSIELQQ